MPQDWSARVTAAGLVMFVAGCGSAAAGERSDGGPTTTARTVSQRLEAPASTAPTLTPTPQTIDGKREIVPHATATSANSAVISAQDIRDYLRTHSIAGPRVGQDGPATIESIDCTTALAVRQIGPGLDLDQTGRPLPEDRPLCVVRLKGHSFSGPLIGGKPSGQSCETAVLVFDATNGDRLQMRVCGSV